MIRIIKQRITRCVLYGLLLAIHLPGSVQAEVLDAVTEPVLVARALPGMAISHDYFMQLLQRALVLGADGRPVPDVRETPAVNQDRSLPELLRCRQLRVYWMGTSHEREKRLRAVLIPLDRGLLGYRRLMLHQRLLPVIEQVSSLERLRHLGACQGVNWPDTLVLRHAGMRVREIANFERIFRELNDGHCELFPRGFYEGDSELDVRREQYPQLQFYEGVMLHYPLAQYFFLNRQDEALAQWIERGLERMIDTGELLAYMKSHPFTREAFPLRSAAHWFALENPDFPQHPRYQGERYWFVPADFAAPAATGSGIAAPPK